MVARVLIVLGLLLLGFDCADFTVSGIALLGAVLIGLGWWVNRTFARDRWIADPVLSAQLAAVDEELDARELATAYVPLPRVTDGRVCRVCRCTDEAACLSGCWWAEVDLCSSCADDAIAASPWTEGGRR
jgi:hypothetical protein